MRVATFGSLTEDLFVAPEKTSLFEMTSEYEKQKYMLLPYGGKLGASYIESHYGGGASNVAVALATLGFETMAFGAIGDDEVGKRIFQNLKQKNVQIDGVKILPSVKSGFSVILTMFDGERTVIFTPEANQQFYAFNPQVLDAFAPDLLHVCHLSALKDAEIRISLANYISGHSDLVFSWNPGKSDIAMGLDYHKKWLSRCQFLFLNAEEAEAFSGISRTTSYATIGDHKRNTTVVHEMADFSQVANVFLNAGVQVVIITDGRKGAVVHSSSDSFFVPPNDSPRVSTLGAGDSFASGFLAGWLETKNLHIAGKCASILAASVVGKRGAQEGLLHKNELFSK